MQKMWISTLCGAQAAGLSPQELTALNMDKSQLLDDVIAGQYGGDPDAVLGEFQVVTTHPECKSTRALSLLLLGMLCSHSKQSKLVLRVLNGKNSVLHGMHPAARYQLLSKSAGHHDWHVALCTKGWTLRL